MPPRHSHLAVLALLAALPAAAAETPTPYREQLTREVRELRALDRASAAGVTLLDEVSRALPELLWLEELTLHGSKVRISGKAYNTNAIASFIESLDRVPGFGEPTLVDATENPGSIYSFQLSFEAGPALPEEGSAEVRELERAKTELRRRLARTEDVPRLLAELRTLVERSDVEVASFVEARPGEDGGAPVDVEVTGATYHELSLFFDRLRTFRVFTRLDALTIRQSQDTDGGTVTASFRLRIPLRLQPE